MQNTDKSGESTQSELRRYLGYVYGDLYEELGYLNSPAILSRLVAGKETESGVPLWDTHVRLRTDLAVDTEISNHQLTRVRLRYSNGHVIFDSTSPDVDTSDSNVNPQFPPLLWDGLTKLLHGEDVLGLRVRRRPLIAAPLWSDGLRSNLASLDVFAALNLFRRSIVLGPPGSGKSTVLKALAICHLGALNRPQKKESPKLLGLWSNEPVTPIFVDLDELVKWRGFPGPSERVTIQVLVDFVVERYERGGDQFRTQLLNDLHGGRALLLLDGLDEVPIPYGVPHALQDRRHQIQDLMRSIRVRFPNCRVIVTSRPAGYSDWTLDGFDIIRLLPLDEDETIELSSKLYKSLGREDALSDDAQAKLRYELSRVPRELREQPLFATLLLLLFLDRQGDLPRQRAGLLNASIRLLLTAWTLPRIGKESLKELLSCTEDELYERLQALAFRVHQESTRNETTELEVTETHIQLGVILEELFELGPHVNPSQALDFLNKQAGILVSPAPRVYRFAHRLLREFLAASYLASQSNCSRLISELLNEHPIAWMEPALLLGDLLLEQKRFADLWAVIEELLSTAGMANEDVRVRKPFLVWLAGRIVYEQGADSSLSATARRVVGILRAGLSQVLYPSSGLPALQRVQAAEVLALLGDQREGVGLSDGIPEIIWCKIPAGQFRMGTNEADIKILQSYPGPAWDFSREQPSDLIDLQEFELSRYPVTVRQYQAFVEAIDGYSTDDWWTTAGLEWRSRHGPAPAGSSPTDATTPQTNLTWFEAAAFCRWLSHKTRELIRLPTEAEWEKAARGTDGRIFPWGNKPDPRNANVVRAGVERVAPVGCFDVFDGPWGADGPAEMIGNVWEWCSTIMQSMAGETYSYPYRNDDGREDLERGDEWLRVTRGGYYRNIPVVARCAYRGRDMPSAPFARQGFRPARSAEQP
jgi:formylglycine-generating enzyme required for sulfatase activity